MFIEEKKMSGLARSLSLWSEVTGSKSFKPDIWILLLTKSDMLKEKISKVSLHTYFDDISIEDGNDYNKCVEYITKKFESNYKSSVPLL